MTFFFWLLSLKKKIKKQIISDVVKKEKNTIGFYLIREFRF